MAFAKMRTPEGLDICYEILGQENKGIPLVLVSGAGMQLLGWPDGFCQMLLDRGHRLIRYDNRDCGESSGLARLPAPAPWLVALKHKLGMKISAPYTLEDMAGDLIHLLDGLGIEKAHLAGISLGGMISQVAAINFGPRVASLTCISSQARNSRHTMPKIGTVVKLMRQPKPGRQGYIDWHQYLVSFLSASPAQGPDDYLRDIAGRMYDRGINDAGTKRQVCAVYASPDRRPALANVAAPTLIIHGTGDPLINPKAGKEVADAIPGAKFELIAGMGHGVFEPSWERLTSLITTHVQGAAQGSIN